MPACTDTDRTIAAARASELWRWRPGYAPSCHFVYHTCEARACDIVAVEYSAVLRSGKVFVSLGRAPLDTVDLFDRLVPVFGCTKTGQVHACGDDCDRRELTCPVSGVRFGEETRDGWWSEYAREGKDNWKMKVFGEFRGIRIEPVNMRERLSLDGDQTYLATAMLEQSRRRARFSKKSEAFDVAFAISAIVLSDERFEDDLRRHRDLRTRLLEQAKRATTHMTQQRIAVSTSAIMQALPSNPESTPILIQNHKQTRDLIVCYAERCIALWHLIYTLADPQIAEMSFRDFCTAALSFFEKGYNIPSWRSGHDVWVVPRDPVLNVFPLNKWCERKIYSEIDEAKISGIMRRAESRVKYAIDGYITTQDEGAVYMRVVSSPYDSIPEGAFGNVKR